MLFTMPSVISTKSFVMRYSRSGAPGSRRQAYEAGTHPGQGSRGQANRVGMDPGEGFRETGIESRDRSMGGVQD